MTSGIRNLFSTLFCPVNILHCVIAILVLGGLYLVSLRNYLLFHGIIELASIAIALSIFIIVWSSRQKITDAFFLIIGISFLFTGGIDLIHMLAYKGMGVFPGNSSDLPTQLWIAARYFQSITFFIATILIGKSLTKDRKYDAGIIFTACAAAFGLILASIFYWQNFPQCFIEGVGLTQFKITSEYVISIILVAAIVILVHKRQYFDPSVWKLLVAAMVFLILGELAFTSYISVYGFMNMLGHLAKLVSFYFFYRAIIVVGVTRPFDLLFRDLKNNEESLRKSEQKYRSLFSNMLDGFAYCKMLYENDKPTDFVYIEVNEAFGRLTGLQNITGKKATDAIPGIRELNPELFDIYGRVALTVTPERFEVYFEPLNVWLSISVYSPEKGYFVAIFENITERKRAELDLLSAQERLKEAHRLAHIGTWNWAMDNDTVMWSEELYNIAGRDPSLPAPTYAEHPHVYTPSSWDRLSSAVTRALTTGEAYNLELELVRPDGSTRWVNAFGGVKRDGNGKVIELHGTVQDITEHKRAEDALALASKKLNLLSSVTRHDIVNQLTALRGYLDLSYDTVTDTALRDFISKEEKIARTIEHQILFTREYQDLGVNAPVWQNVNESILPATAHLPMRGILVNVDRADLEVYADPLFEKVFYNLIDNALRYGGEQMTTIRVSSHESESGLTIICEDDGAGITEGDKKRIFDKGFGKNTGLGLFLCREILSITGITITENGIQGKGARFEITVPKGIYRFAGTRATSV